MTPKLRLLLLAALLHPAKAQADPAAYYKGIPANFSTRPDATKSSTSLTRVGPIGMSMDLIQPAFTMKITGIEKGGPAEATGALKPGQIIESVNGKKLADISPYVQIADWIAEAEATDGKLVLAVAEKPGGATTDVTVSIPVLGAYSATWPLDCPKSERIVRNFAEYLKQPEAQRGFGDIGMLFLLSTGDDKDLEAVKVMGRHNIPINDLHSLLSPKLAEFLNKPNDIHFNGKGSAAMAEQISKVVREKLEGDAAPNP